MAKQVVQEKRPRGRPPQNQEWSPNSARYKAPKSKRAARKKAVRKRCSPRTDTKPPLVSRETSPDPKSPSASRETSPDATPTEKFHATKTASADATAESNAAIAEAAPTEPKPVRKTRVSVWRCPTCTLEHARSVAACSLCGCPRPHFQ